MSDPIIKLTTCVVHVVGKTNENEPWELIGIFSTYRKASINCISHEHFTFPVTIDKVYSSTLILEQPTGLRWPFSERAERLVKEGYVVEAQKRIRSARELQDNEGMKRARDAIMAEHAKRRAAAKAARAKAKPTPNTGAPDPTASAV